MKEKRLQPGNRICCAASSVTVCRAAAKVCKESGGCDGAADGDCESDEGAWRRDASEHEHHCDYLDASGAVQER